MEWEWEWNWGEEEGWLMQNLCKMLPGDQFKASGEDLEKRCHDVGKNDYPQQLKAKPGSTFDCSGPIAWIHVP
jgi:hypothetical protein